MNLATEPWVPVTGSNDQPGVASLEKVFGQGESIRDLDVRPHERIALMRLLLGIAHAGLDGPSEHEAWLRCREGMVDAALDHLTRHRHAFELLGKGAWFGQLYSGTNHSPRLDGLNPTRASKLEFLLATGDNSTLFDNGACAVRAFTPPALVTICLWKSAKP